MKDYLLNRAVKMLKKVKSNKNIRKDLVDEKGRILKLKGSFYISKE
jgi:hypothetical protein